MKPLTGCFLLLVLLLFWTVFCRRLADQARTAVNAVLVGFIAFIILYATILTRTPSDYEAILTPFATLAAARVQPELYREMLMNVFLFFPLGLTLSNALPWRWNYRRRIGVTVLAGCLLSAGIEYAQYRFALDLRRRMTCSATRSARCSARRRCLSHTPSNHTKKGLGIRT